MMNHAGAISAANVDIDLQKASPAASVVEYVDLSNGESRSEIVSSHLRYVISYLDIIMTSQCSSSLQRRISSCVANLLTYSF